MPAPAGRRACAAGDGRHPAGIAPLSVKPGGPPVAATRSSSASSQLPAAAQLHSAGNGPLPGKPGGPAAHTEGTPGMLVGVLHTEGIPGMLVSTPCSSTAQPASGSVGLCGHSPPVRKPGGPAAAACTSSSTGSARSSAGASPASAAPPRSSRVEFEQQEQEMATSTSASTTLPGLCTEPLSRLARGEPSSTLVDALSPLRGRRTDWIGRLYGP